MLVIALRTFWHREARVRRGQTLDLPPEEARPLLNAQLVRFPTAADLQLRTPEGHYLRRDLRATE